MNTTIQSKLTGNHVALLGALMLPCACADDPTAETYEVASGEPLSGTSGDLPTTSVAEESAGASSSSDDMFPSDPLPSDMGLDAPAARVVLVDVRGEIHEAHYVAVSGFAITENDMILDDLAAIEGGTRSIVKVGNPWDGGVVPYIVDGGIDPALVPTIGAAIEHWHRTTGITLIPRTNEANYVRFVPDPEGCRSHVGMMGGEQQIQLAAGCNTLHKVVHEIGHAVGLLHEQGRSDRDAYVNILFDNIQPEYLPQFKQQLDGTLVGTYDYESVMQYPSYSFAKNPQLPTITKKDGFRINETGLGLSCGDVAGVEFLYGGVPPHARTEIVLQSAPGDWVGVFRVAEQGLVACGLEYMWINPRGQGLAGGWRLAAGDRTVVADLDGDDSEESVRVSSDGEWIGVIRSHGYRLALDWIGHDWVNLPNQPGDSGWDLQPGDRFLAADIDGDSRDEVIATSADGEWIGALREQDGPLVTTWIGFDWLGEWNLQAGDQFVRVNVDGDARDELVVVSTTGEWIGLLAGGDGTLTASWIGFDWLGEWNLQGGDKFTAADLDGDGREELFVVSGDGEYAGILREQGGVLAPSWMAYDWIGAWNLRGGDQFLAADVDGDGRDELVVASLDGDYLGVLREEDGALKATWMTFDWVNLAGQSGANGWDLRSGDVLVAADVDGDGGRELVVRNVGGEWIGLLGWDDEHLNAEWIGLDWIHHPGHGGEDGWKLQPGDTAYAVSAEP